MKKLSLLFLFVSILLFSQEKNLISLSEGEFVGIVEIFDNQKELYGYISIYDKGLTDKDNKEFEVILIDPNLNKVSSVFFVLPSLSNEFEVYMNLNNEIIVKPKLSAEKFYDKFKIYGTKIPEPFIVDFNKRKITNYISYCLEEESGVLVECTSHETLREKFKDLKAERKEKGYNYHSNNLQLEDKSFVATQYKSLNSFNKNKDYQIFHFDANKKLKWKYNLENHKKNLHKLFNYEIGIGEKDNLAYYILESYKGSLSNSLELLGLDLTTGKQILREDLTEKVLKKTISIKTFEIKNHLIALYALLDKNNNRMGFRRMKLNYETQNIEWNDLTFKTINEKYKENKKIKIDKKAFTSNGFFLKEVAAFINDDGSSYIFLEEFKWSTNYNPLSSSEYSPVNRNFYILRTDKDFNIENLEIIEKDKSRNSYTDFLYWQKLDKNKNDVVFFYQDKRKDEQTRKKVTMLGVCSIVDGKFKNEEIQLNNKSTESEIVPLFAKKGYVLIWEKDKENKSSSIRLERINL